MRVNKQILFPFFLEISIKHDDSFWRYLYEDLAYGRYPGGIFINNNYLCCVRKGKEFSYKLPNRDNELTEDNIEELHSLLKNKAGLLSSIDCLKKKENMISEEQQKTINKKQYRQTLLQNFIVDKGKTYKLDLKVLKKLMNFINIGFLFKVITVNEIEFDHNQNSIVNIKNIYFKKGKVIIDYENLFSFPSSFFFQNLKENDKKICIDTLWKSFLEISN